jgi:uncharacterized membrane protein
MRDRHERDRPGVDRAGRGARPRRDEEFGRCQLVELADDAIAGGAGDPTVAISAAMPMTMPSTVSTIRPGRANMASAS